MILTRVNTITGVAYSDDPTIFALELANEPHTSDDYETIRGVSPGLLVKAWMEVIVKTVRVVDKNHMVSSCVTPSQSVRESFCRHIRSTGLKHSWRSTLRGRSSDCLKSYLMGLKSSPGLHESYRWM